MLAVATLVLLSDVVPDLLAASVFASGVALAALTAAYTGWLFQQAKGRVLWMRRGLWLHLMVQAVVAGAAFALLFGPALGLPGLAAPTLRAILMTSLILHALFVLTESRMAPKDREREYERASRLITHGPFSMQHRILGMAGGVAAPALLILNSDSYVAGALAGLLALTGLWVEEHTLVRAGQSLPIS